MTGLASARPCRGYDCPNEAGTLQCPTCLNLGLNSSWCSQDCFKRNWNTHKAVHTAGLKGPKTFDAGRWQKQVYFFGYCANPCLFSDGSFDPYPSFHYTGPLRARYPLSPRRPVPENIILPDYAKSGVLPLLKFGAKVRIYWFSSRSLLGNPSFNHWQVFLCLNSKWEELHRSRLIMQRILRECAKSARWVVRGERAKFVFNLWYITGSLREKFWIWLQVILDPE